jgi:hypothetical protein
MNILANIIFIAAPRMEFSIAHAATARRFSTMAMTGE